MKALIPMSPDQLGGPFIEAVEGSFEVLAQRGKAMIIRFISLDDRGGWCKDFHKMYCQVQHDPQVIKVIREATLEEYKLFRVPIWIQDPEIPECCGQQCNLWGRLTTSDFAQSA